MNFFIMKKCMKIKLVILILEKISKIFDVSLKKSFFCIVLNEIPLI